MFLANVNKFSFRHCIISKYLYLKYTIHVVTMHKKPTLYNGYGVCLVTDGL